MSNGTDTGNVTGTKDKDCNLVWFTQSCLDNALCLEQYVADANRDGDTELFRKAQADSKNGAQRGKSLLKARLGD